MEYLIAGGGGLALGSLIAWLKYFILWRPFVQGRTDQVGTRSMLSSLVNILTLLAVFWLRGVWPYSFYVTILAVACGLSIGGKLSANLSVKRLRAELNAPLEQENEQ